MCQRTSRVVMVLSVVLLAGCGIARDSSDNACKTPKQEPGACVLISSCPVLLKLLQKAKDENIYENFIYLKNSTCDLKEPTVCCPLKDSHVVGSTPNPMPWIDGDSSTTEGVPDEVPEEPIDVSASPRLNMLPLRTCGSFFEDKIIKGLEVALLEYPWMALLGYETPDQTGFNCGGTLINNRYVLTAAHCVTELLPMHKLTFVRLGELHIYNKTDCEEKLCAPPVEDYAIEEIVAHPNYNKPMKYANDIALLRLNQTIAFKERIRPICLPIGVEQRRDFVSGRMVVTGWGITDEGIRNPRLLKMALPLVPHQRCVQSYSGSKIHVSSSRQVCAGNVRGSYMCSGDSGGPLQGCGEVEDGVQMVQFGIVSFGPTRCATESLPGVYTKVGFYMDWILKILRE